MDTLGTVMDEERQHVTAEEIDTARTENGGWTRDTLAKWGIGWPPPKGWRKRLLEEGYSKSCMDAPFLEGKKPDLTATQQAKPKRWSTPRR